MSWFLLFSSWNYVLILFSAFQIVFVVVFYVTIQKITFIFSGYIKESSLDTKASPDLATNSYRCFDKAYRFVNVKSTKRDILWNQSEFYAVLCLISQKHYLIILAPCILVCRNFREFLLFRDLGQVRFTVCKWVAGIWLVLLL